MKHEYREGPEALENFKRGMEALFEVPKSAVQKKKQARKPATLRKSKKSGKDKVRRVLLAPSLPPDCGPSRFLACQLGIGQTPAADLGHGESEAVGISKRVIFRGPIVIAKYLFVEVVVKVKRFHRYIGSAKIALQQTPKVLQPIRVNLTLDVFLGVIHNLMDEALLNWS